MLLSEVKTIWAPCPFCGGECRPEEVTLPLCREKNTYVIVQEIPAEVCQECGEILFSVSTAAALLGLLNGKNLPIGTNQVPVYRFGSHATTSE
ncbi:MAG TPA: YgiT-type zinc finger protein [Chthonomonas sp.]|uniref:YgiT-type zinc finger protein n=1 Tax=Chthonomonas sp. TaxID=2282153 RepID=UPI002B4AF5C5|nr:YgiT-type zinc finger protein [Chthonomonas sp.]HLI49371.1 YgiT-type zinc finger protein [Chthonomonas sp.]